MDLLVSVFTKLSLNSCHQHLFQLVLKFTHLVRHVSKQIQYCGHSCINCCQLLIFQKLFSDENVVTVHSEEASLEDIFISITGRGLIE